MRPIKITLLIPTRDEEDSIENLFEKICKVLDDQSIKNFEVIFIDDGSLDSTFEVMCKLRERDSRVKVLKLRRNFGKSVALDQGFKQAAGEIVFTMDADLQDDPREIPRFIEKIGEGYDLVSGWKQKRMDPVFTKNLPSKLFNFMIGVVSGLKLHDFNCGFKAYRRVLVKELSIYGDLHRYIPAIAHAIGFKVCEIPIIHHARLYGKSKYGIERFFHGFFDFMTVTFLTKYLKKPMHFFGWIGSLFSCSGFVVCFYLSILWLQGEEIGSRPLLLLGVLLIVVGIQFLSTGLVAEMITYGRQKNVQESVIEISLVADELNSL